MKRSPALQKKFDELAENSRISKQKAYLEKLKSELDLNAQFKSNDSNLSVNSWPVEYVASYKYMEKPLLDLNNSETSNTDLIDSFVPYIKSFKFRGEALFYLSDDKYGGCWLQVEEKYLLDLVCYEIKNTDLAFGFECLISSTESEMVLALFEDEYRYLVCKFSGSS